MKAVSWIGIRALYSIVDNKELFFQPLAMPIPISPDRGEPTGAAIILKDVTQVHEQQELKRGIVSTVSHQLKTPLTSLRMSIYLLLDERLGALNNKQTELLLAAREDSERLVSILEDLLDIYFEPHKFVNLILQEVRFTNLSGLKYK